MGQVHRYYIKPTALVPNSPLPLLYYPNMLKEHVSCSPEQVYEHFLRNGWHAQWIFRYGPTQQSHYHSGTHECMAVLSGSATIRFGVSDLDAPSLRHIEDRGVHHGDTHGVEDENEIEIESDVSVAPDSGGIEIHASKGDVFLIPAGVAHKTYDAVPAADPERLTPGDGHGFGHGSTDGQDAKAQSDVRNALAHIALSGFTMLGAYPERAGPWDFALGGEHVGRFEDVWAVPKPSRDPVLGERADGLCGLW